MQPDLFCFLLGGGLLFGCLLIAICVLLQTVCDIFQFCLQGTNGDITLITCRGHSGFAPEHRLEQEYVWTVSLWPGCLIKWLEKSDWLQGWCIIDERAWLIENILYSRGGRMSVWVGVRGRSKWLHSVWTTSSVPAQQCFDWYSARAQTAKYLLCVQSQIWTR